MGRSGSPAAAAVPGCALAGAAACAGEAPGPTVPAGPVARGDHVDGLRHGTWRIAYPDGSVEEGPCAAGRLHGEWVLRDAAGRVAARALWCNGRAAEPGRTDCQ